MQDFDTESVPDAAILISLRGDQLYVEATGNLDPETIQSLLSAAYHNISQETLVMAEEKSNFSLTVH
jgi:hypothetical protein